MPALKKNNNRKRVNPRSTRSTYFIFFGFACILSGIIIIASIFIPVVSEEIAYSLRQIPFIPTLSVTSPVNTDLGLVIPKIGANAAIVADVDPNDSRIYQNALTKGVAHAKGTALPGNNGVSFLFSHSSATLIDANRYNSIFYLLTKLAGGDEIWIYTKGTKVIYSVTGAKVVEAGDVSYLTKQSTDKELILMTCWPPGTNFKRYIVTASVKNPPK